MLLGFLKLLFLCELNFPGWLEHLEGRQYELQNTACAQALVLFPLTEPQADGRTLLCHGHFRKRSVRPALTCVPASERACVRACVVVLAACVCDVPVASFFP